MLGCRRCGAPTTSGYCHISSQCEKTYAKHVGDAYMTEFVFQNDFFVETAKSSDQQLTNRGNSRTL